MTLPELNALGKEFARLAGHGRRLEGRLARIEAGHRAVGRVPYGYKIGYDEETKAILIPSEPQAEHVREAFRIYLREKHLHAVVLYLMSVAPLVRRWSGPGVAYMLSNRVYVGTLVYNGLSRPGKHEPLVAHITFNRVQMLKRKNRHSGGRHDL